MEIDKNLIDLMGYTKDLTPLKMNRIEKVLLNYIREDNKIMTKCAYITNRIVLGYTPQLTENYSYYSAKLEGNTKPKNLYTIEKDNFYNEITKIEYDFANWLIENNLNTIEAIASARIIEEKRLIDIVEAEEYKKSEELKNAQLQEQQQKAFEEWTIEAINNYSNEYKINIAKDIFIDKIGQYNKYQLTKLLVCIDNIDNINCKNKLCSWLHNDNKASKKVFEHVTGLKLPSTHKEVKEFILNLNSSMYLETKEYKARVKHEQIEVELKDYYIRNRDNTLTKVKGSEFKNNYDLQLFIYKNEKGYNITEATTGMSLIGNNNNKSDIIKQLKERMTDSLVNRVKNEINRLVGINGSIAL